MVTTPRTAALNNAEVALNHVGEPAVRYTAIALVFAVIHAGDAIARLAGSHGTKGDDDVMQ